MDRLWPPLSMVTELRRPEPWWTLGSGRAPRRTPKTERAHDLTAQDLLYLQDASGYFARHATPSPAQVDNGVSMVIGDFKGDGRPDIAVDAHPGGLLLWENISAVPPDTHAFTLRLISRERLFGNRRAHQRPVRRSGRDPSHHLRCEDGRSRSTHAHIALPGCTDTESSAGHLLPSGAQVTGVVPRSPFIPLTEGAWLRLEDTESVTLDPIAGAAQQACPCRGLSCAPMLFRDMHPKRQHLRPLVAAPLDGHPPGITLRGTGPAWLMTSEPALPRPQSTTRFTFQHVERSGPLAVERLSVDVGGVAVPHPERATHPHCSSLHPRAQPDLTVALKRAGKTIASWTEATVTPSRRLSQ